MSEVENSSCIKLLLENQPETQPKIEEVIADFLSGDRLNNALAFVEFLKINKMTPHWYATNCWAVKCKGKYVCQIRIHGCTGLYALKENSWNISKFEFYGRDFLEEFINDEKLKEVIFKNVKYCSNCWGCGPGESMTILGKSIDLVCRLEIKNPDMEELESVKKIVLANRNFLRVKF